MFLIDWREYNNNTESMHNEKSTSHVNDEKQNRMHRMINENKIME